MSQAEPNPAVKLRCYKKRHATREEAQAAVHRTAAKARRVQSRRGAMHEYYCTTCDGWHVGHVRGYEKTMRVGQKTRKKLAAKRRRQAG